MELPDTFHLSDDHQRYPPMVKYAINNPLFITAKHSYRTVRIFRGLKVPWIALKK